MSYRLRNRKVKIEKSSNKKQSKKTKDDIIGPKVSNESEYDADSENELRKIEMDCLQIKSDTDSGCEDEIKKRKDEFTNILSKFVTPITTSKNIVNSNHYDSASDVDLVNEKNKSKCIDFNIQLMDIEKSKKILFAKPTKENIKSRKRKAFKPLDKENITPPDQSTPANIMQKVVYNQLNESLFGFNDMNSPEHLTENDFDDGMSAMSFTSMKTYGKTFSNSPPGKRKKPDLDRSGFNDIPIDMPKKKTKRKKEKTVVETEEYLENIRMQFREIEMHELAIE